MPVISTRGAGSARGFGFSGGAAGFSIDYLVVAGGGAGGSNYASGGGGGGLRTSWGSGTLDSGTPLRMKAGDYTVTVGASAAAGNEGNNSSISAPGFTTFSATGGGRGYGGNSGPATAGGSGGGGQTKGAGNEGGYTPPEGNDGGDGASRMGGGGASAVGGSNPGGTGGAGYAVDISGSSTTYAGGGGGGGYIHSNTPGPGGAGGGGNGGAVQGTTGGAGTNGLGGGGGGAGADNGTGGAGGSGIVIFRAPSARTFTVAPGTNTTSTAPNGDKIATFTVSGTLTLA